jgi:hypothetical protein
VNQQNPSSTVGVDDFFDNIGGTGAPTAWLSEIGHGVIGTIESQRTVDYIPFGKKDPEVLDDGRTRKQLVVILQTDQRNWDGVKEAPWVDREDHSKGLKDAVVASGAKGGLHDGARFGVKVVDLEDTNQGNPKKVHKALYEPPAASDAFLGNQQQAPAQQAAPAAAPAPQAAPAAPAPAPSQDPWATPAAPAQSAGGPPF